MAHLWLSVEDQAAVFPLDGEAFSLTHPPRRILAPPDKDALLGAALLKVGDPNGALWVIVAGSDQTVHVNEYPLLLGIRALEDRDRIWVSGVGSFYFSTESLAAVECFSGAGQKFFCPRCKLEIEEGQTAVKCPQCSRWHHQTDEMKCWTYTRHCALCPQPTSLDAGYLWMPEELL
jgi:Zn finger protein HypA/HybF involved in hydrogenase expression